MPSRTLRFAQFVVLVVVAAAIVTCTDSRLPTPPIDQPMFAVSDGGVTGGNPDVFFLPPLVESTRFSDRPPNPNLAGAVDAKICKLNATEMNPAPDPDPLFCPGGSGDVATLPMTYDAIGEFYRVNWQTGDLTQTGNNPLDDNFHYRIEIVVGTVSLAFRDMDPDDNPNRGSCRRNRDPFCQFENGSNVAIKVHIASAALCFDPTTGILYLPCASASFDPTVGGSLALFDENGDPLTNFDVTGSGAGAQTLQTTNGGPVILTLQPCVIGDLSTVIDIPTFGDCVEIEPDPDPVSGVVSICSGQQDAATEGNLTEAQIALLTIHRNETGTDVTFALPHSSQFSCPDPIPPEQIGMSPFDQVIEFARNVWGAVREQVLAWLEPEPLLASMAICDEGCSSDSDDESGFQVARPSQMNYFGTAAPDGELGTHTAGDPVTVQVKVTDPGDDPVEGAKLTAAVAPGGGTGSVSPSTPVTTGSDGIATFTFTIGPGANLFEVSGRCVGVHLAAGGGGPLAPSPGDPDPVQCDDTAVLPFAAVLPFTATGLVPLIFVDDPPTDDLNLGNMGDPETATLDDFYVCTAPATAGFDITSLVAVKNNGDPVELGNLPGGPPPDPLGTTAPLTTGDSPPDGCVSFSGVTINKTGAYRLVANGVFESLKFNVRPLRRN